MDCETSSCLLGTEVPLMPLSVEEGALRNECSDFLLFFLTQVRALLPLVRGHHQVLSQEQRSRAHRDHPSHPLCSLDLRFFHHRHLP